MKGVWLINWKLAMILAIMCAVYIDSIYTVHRISQID